MVCLCVCRNRSNGARAIGDLGELGLDFEHGDRGIRPLKGALLFGPHRGGNGGAARLRPPFRPNSWIHNRSRSASRCARRPSVNATATSITGLTGRSDGIWTRIFLNIVILPSLCAKSARSRSCDDTCQLTTQTVSTHAAVSHDASGRRTFKARLHRSRISERQAILRCSVSSGVPEASTRCQFTVPTRRSPPAAGRHLVSRPTHRALAVAIRESRVARSAVRKSPTKRAWCRRARSGSSARCDSRRKAASRMTEHPCARTRVAVFESRSYTRCEVSA